jgi:hypothetical protein
MSVRAVAVERPTEEMTALESTRMPVSESAAAAIESAEEACKVRGET